MRLRTELAAGLALLLVLGAGAALLGSRRARVEDDDARRSTFLAKPQGARGWAEALERLGVRVERWRRRAPDAARLPDRPRSVFAVIDPSLELDAYDARLLTGWAQAAPGRDLLLVGAGAEAAMRCYGYAIVPLRDSSPVGVAGTGAAARGGVRRAYTRHVLVAETVGIADSGALGGEADFSRERCGTPSVMQARVLAQTGTRRPAALRLAVAGDGSTAPHAVTLVADGRLFTNRALRTTTAGELALGLVAGRYDRVVVDEYHHGFRAGGSFAAALLAWSTSSPWGWALWQLAVVAVVALAAAGVRFGPARAGIERKRRSPLEHVEALATALAARQGHDVAVRLLVRGLRRRLGQPPAAAGSERAWLATLDDVVRGPRARAAVTELQSLTSSPQPAAGVLRAAQAVEDVWQDLRPSA